MAFIKTETISLLAWVKIEDDKMIEYGWKFFHSENLNYIRFQKYDIILFDDRSEYSFYIII